MALAFGSKKQNFGLSTNMTLPISGSAIEPDPKILAENAFMPEERKPKRKKRARFAIDQEQSAETKGAEPKEQKRPSWIKRLFQRRKKKDKSLPYVVRNASNKDDKGVKRSESDSELPTSSKEQREGNNAKRGDRRTKAQSTALENISVQADVSTTSGRDSGVHIIFKPKSPTNNGNRKVVLRESTEGPGLHLSGGLPPVTVTYVEPGGLAELAGLSVGDTILSVNSLNCKKKVEVAQLMALKVLIQQAPEERAAVEDMDEAEWKQIKDKQNELLELEGSLAKITSLDSESDEDTSPSPPPPPPPQQEDEEKQKRRRKKKTSTASAGGEEEVGDPLVTSTPIKEPDADKVMKKKKKRASNSHVMTSGDESTKDASMAAEPTADKAAKKKKRASNSHVMTSGDESTKDASMAAEPAADKAAKKKKRVSNSHVVTAAEEPTTDKAAKKKKRVSNSHVMSSGDDSTKDTSTAPEEPPAGDDSTSKRKKKGQRKNSSSTTVTKEEEPDSPEEKKDKMADEKEKGKKKRKTSASSKSAEPNKDITESPTKKATKKTKKAAKTSSSDIQADLPADISVDTNQDYSSSLLPQESLSVDEVDGPRRPPQIDRSDRSRRSSSPKSRYHMGVVEDEKVTIGVIERKESKDESPKKKKSKEKEKKDKEESKKGKKKAKEAKGKGKSKSTEDGKKEKDSKAKRKKSVERKVSASSKVSEEPKSTAEEASSPVAEDASVSVSAAISGSIESHTLEFKSPKKGTSKSSLASKDSQQSEESTNTLPRSRRKSSGSIKASTSSSNMREFREELREASRSQHDMSKAGKSDMTIEIDENIKVSRSGLIKGEKTPVRPSIFDQSSSPEPEVEKAPISSGPLEDAILDSDLKVKRSGLMMVKKTSAADRPSILYEKSAQTKRSPTDIEPGEMKYNRQVTEDIDAAIPQTSPTLGLVAARDRLDTVNRSLTKRRPPSLKRSQFPDSNENKMGAEGGSSQMSAVRQLFEKSGADNAYQSRFSKLAVSKGNTSPTKNPGEKVNGQVKPAGAPSWIAMAQKRSSVFEDKDSKTKVVVPAAPKPAAATAAAPATTKTAASAPSNKISGGDSGGNKMPEMGHVAKRLAMFQKN